MRFANDCHSWLITRENFWHIALLVTQKSLFMVTCAFFCISPELRSWSCFNNKTSFFMVGVSHELNKMVIRPSHLYHGDTYIDKIALLYNERLVGVTKASLINFAISDLADFEKVSIISFETYLYFTGTTANMYATGNKCLVSSEMWRKLMNKMFLSMTSLQHSNQSVYYAAMIRLDEIPMSLCRS